MQPQTINEIEQKTQVYWNLSKAYNGRTGKLITAEHLFRRANEILQVCDPSRPIAKRLWQLKDEVVRGPELEDAPNMTAMF